MKSLCAVLSYLSRFTHPLGRDQGDKQLECVLIVDTDSVICLVSTNKKKHFFFFCASKTTRERNKCSSCYRKKSKAQ